MFNFFHKKVLVGRVPVRYIAPNGESIIIDFLLYTKNNKRFCESAIKHNAHVVKEMYKKSGECCSISEFVCHRHRCWNTIIRPWIDSGKLNDIYAVDDTGMSLASKIYNLSGVRKSSGRQ